MTFLKTLAWLGLLGLSTVGAVPALHPLRVWVPEQHLTATLSGRGLITDSGRPLNLPPPEFTPVPDLLQLEDGLLLRQVYTRGTTAGRLDVLDSRGHVQATLGVTRNMFLPFVTSTLRGPCYTVIEGRSPYTRCVAPDLKTEWTAFGGTPLLITHSGDVAYVAAWPAYPAPYRRNVPITRIDLRTRTKTFLSVDAEVAEKDVAYRRNVARTYDALNFTPAWRELPGGHFLVCVTLTMPKFGCRLEVLDAQARHLTTLKGDAWVFVPKVTQDGKAVYAFGNTLQVWEVGTGERTAAIHDPRWQKAGRFPVNAFLTPDNRQAAIVTAKTVVDGWPRGFQVYVYDLATGTLLRSFAVAGK